MDSRVGLLWRSAMVVVSLILLLACGKEESSVQLPPDAELVDLICDLHLAEASMNRVELPRQDTVSLLLRTRVARDHGITAEEMDAWLTELQSKPEHAITVYDSVVVELERRMNAR